MPTLEDIKAAFTELLRHHRSIKIIVWDLDETLGPSPGWTTGPLREYICNPIVFQRLMRWLWKKHRIKSTLISRNSAFCDEMMLASIKEAIAFGFHGVAKCPRKQMQRPKTNFIRIVKPHEILLIEDQESECRMAAKTGSYAILCPRGVTAMDALVERGYRLYRPGGQATLIT